MFLKEILGKWRPKGERCLRELFDLTEKYAHFGLNFDDLTFVGYESAGKLHTGACGQFRRTPAYISGKEVHDLMNSSNLCKKCGDLFTLVGGSLSNNSLFQIDLKDVVESFKGAFKIYDLEDSIKSVSRNLSVTKASELLQILKSNELDAADIFTLFKGECDEDLLKAETLRIQDLFIASLQTAQFQSKLARALPRLDIRVTPPTPQGESFIVIYQKASLTIAREVKLSLLAWGTPKGDISVIPIAAFFHLGGLQMVSKNNPRLLFELPERPSDEHLEFMNSVFNPDAPDDLSLKEIYKMAQNI